MLRVAASLATVALALVLAACGGDGAEPGASKEATLVLDFQPNAVHTGIYVALADGFYEDRGVELEVRAPGASSDAPKLLVAGRAEFAILDVTDYGIARQQGAQIEAVGTIVGRPLAAVIAGDRDEIRRPRDLEGGEVGVTGLPSDDAVLDAVLEADGADPESVERVTIGFNSVAAVSAGRVDAATAFWNAEGVALRELGVPTQEFRVDDYGASRYPELLLVTSRQTLEEEPGLVRAVKFATREGYAGVMDAPDEAVDALVGAGDGFVRKEQAAQLSALLDADGFRQPSKNQLLRGAGDALQGKGFGWPLTIEDTIRLAHELER